MWIIKILLAENIGCKSQVTEQLCIIFRNIFPDNLAQAMFQHVKTAYETVNVSKKRAEYHPVNETNDTSTDFVSNVTLEFTNSTGFKKVIVTYQEQVDKRSLQYNDGINVLGKVKEIISYSVFCHYMYRPCR